MLVHFPKHLKSFYMPGLKDDPNYTESVDILVPGVGEVVGGSMRISDLKELVAGYKREGIPMEPYYWFTDQRKYGTTEHGGYGLGVEVSWPVPFSNNAVADCLAIPSVDAWKVHRPRVQFVPQVHGTSYSMIQAV
jgi:asparaginyl-tRNA synthetase